MALSAKLVRYDAPASTGSQGYTGAGFQPKSIIVFAGLGTAIGSSADVAMCIGFGAEDLSQCVTGTYDRDNVGTTVSRSATSDVDIIRINQSGASISLSAELTSMDSDGCTLNWANTTSGADFFILYLGGADLTNSHAGQINIGTGTGNITTVCGFNPDGCLFTSNRVGFGAGAGDSSNNTFSFGAGTDAAEFTSAFKTQSAVGTANTHKYQRSVRNFAMLTAGSDTVYSEGDYVSKTSNGLTINISNAGASETVCYLALKGAQIYVGVADVNTTTGNQSITAPGFQPSVVIMSSFNNTATTSNVATAQFSFGVGISSTERACIHVGSADAVSPSQADTDIDDTKLLKMITPGSPPATAIALDMVSLDSTGWTHNVVTADGTAKQFGYIAIGNGLADTRKLLPAVGAGR